MVRALDLQSGGPDFKSRSDRWLDLFTVVPSSNPLPRQPRSQGSLLPVPAEREEREPGNEVATFRAEKCNEHA